MSGITAGLLRWAVYRSLDTLTGARYDRSGELAGARLERWRLDSATDDGILAELTHIYGYNPSHRGPDEPVVTVKSDYLPERKGAAPVPALWASLDNLHPQFRRTKSGEWVFTSPHAMGLALVDIIRLLMRSPVPPPMPAKTPLLL
ncbi:hypothetical protein [Rhodocista pekingensis]|uniref:Uncharacterized protein n=1 Tax=Rhodocista pekingensis TaxID=201185 RepID=A0ABW2KYN1_9PROT